MPTQKVKTMRIHAPFSVLPGLEDKVPNGQKDLPTDSEMKK